jgi:hypothetical protein
MKKIGKKNKTQKKSLRILNKGTRKFQNNSKLKRNIERLLKNTNKSKPIEQEFRDFKKIALKFERFFYSILKMEDIFHNNDDFSILKATVEEKLKEVEQHHGSLLKRLEKENISIRNINPNDDLIEIYYDVLHFLRNGDLEYFRIILTNELIDEFISSNVNNMNVNDKNIDEDLLNMFSGLGFEKNISNIFKTLKL